MPGEFSLYGRLTRKQNIEYFANLSGGVPAVRIGELAERLGVDLVQRFASYSKGDKQKIALVITLMHQPELLIFDEPASGPDSLVQQNFYALIATVAASFGDGYPTPATRPAFLRLVGETTASLRMRNCGPHPAKSGRTRKTHRARWSRARW